MTVAWPDLELDSDPDAVAAAAAVDPVTPACWHPHVRQWPAKGLKV